MARLPINLGTPPSGADGDPVRTAFEKVNAMTQELYARPDGGGWGANAIPLAGQPNADQLQKISALFVFGNGGTNIPTPYCIIEQQVVGGGGYVRQIARDINGPNTWERKFTNLQQNVPWDLVVTSANATLDPQSAGGLMSMTLINGWAVEKYANGIMCVSGQTVTPVMPANQVTPHRATVPNVNFVGDVMVMASPQPTNSLDFFGAVTAYLEDATTAAAVIRNGATAQAFVIRLMMKGRWK